MQRLNRSILVNAPSGFSLAYLATYFLECGPENGGKELSLRYPLPSVLVDGLTIEKRVRIALRYSAGRNDDHGLSISWHPVSGGALPDFSGTVLATPESETGCRLTIAGTYTPPGGIVGLIFDQLVGKRISSATLLALLDDFRGRIETDYQVRLVP